MLYVKTAVCQRRAWASGVMGEAHGSSPRWPLLSLSRTQNGGAAHLLSPWSPSFSAHMPKLPLDQTDRAQDLISAVGPGWPCGERVPTCVVGALV